MVYWRQQGFFYTETNPQKSCRRTKSNRWTVRCRGDTLLRQIYSILVLFCCFFSSFFLPFFESSRSLLVRCDAYILARERLVTTPEGGVGEGWGCPCAPAVGHTAFLHPCATSTSPPHPIPPPKIIIIKKKAPRVTVIRTRAHAEVKEKKIIHTYFIQTRLSVRACGRGKRENRTARK